MPLNRVLRLATRGSELALWQTRRVASLLAIAHPGLEVELVTVSATGDRRATVPVWEMGGQGVFVREVQAAVLNGRADAAVHSAKDLRPVESDGLCLAAVPERADARDVLVGAALWDLPTGAVVATGSQRRRAQLAASRPDLVFEGLRGSIGARLTKIPPGGAIVVALAALQRLGLHPGAHEVLSTEVMLPQVGQGALAVEAREDDAPVLALLAAIEDPSARTELEAERAFLATIGGGCDLPVAGHAATTLDHQLSLEGLLAAPDGRTVVRRLCAGSPAEPVALGGHLANLVLSEGGSELLAVERQLRQPDGR
ncbi:MAG TPA: hydroxymethylbilane synthase [Acidimicrobiales bacterium]|nr:hydroxymethylbilane synthase [Acidimicrobiales bacterium]